MISQIWELLASWMEQTLSWLDVGLCLSFTTLYLNLDLNVELLILVFLNLSFLTCKMEVMLPYKVLGKSKASGDHEMPNVVLAHSAMCHVPRCLADTSNKQVQIGFILSLITHLVSKKKPHRNVAPNLFP